MPNNETYAPICVFGGLVGMEPLKPKTIIIRLREIAGANPN